MTKLSVKSDSASNPNHHCGSSYLMVKMSKKVLVDTRNFTCF